MANWWSAKDGQQYGPIDSAQLQQLAQSGELQPHDLIFKEGGTDWVQASTVRGLFPAPAVPSTLAPVLTNPPEPRVGDLVAKFGMPEAVFKPSTGQTMAGVIAASGLGIAALVLAITGVGLPTESGSGTVGNCLRAVGVGAVMLLLAFVIWAVRKWRFMICPLGLIQVHTTRTESLAWAEVTEVVETRRKKFGIESTLWVTVFASASPMTVNPINLRARDKLFQALLSAAKQHGIAVRVEWKDD